MEANSADKITGKRLTFFQLLSDYNIQIPIIQRDYAQGRQSATEVRNLFLDALVTYLEENIKNRDLDFIYGNKQNEAVDDVVKFVPLDGQQRLTTLFLLHWYLANKDGLIAQFQELLVANRDTVNPKSKFSYETRTSSKEFCDALVQNTVVLNKLSKPDKDLSNGLSKTIKDSNWYFLSWDSDPTIQSMLNMLDDIHEKFKDKEGFYGRLVSLENPVITFQFLDLKEFNLTDDLYIKMNARGIPLTPFENFKARFEQYISRSSFNDKHGYSLVFNCFTKEVDLKTYFSYRIDTNWANLFWAHSLSDKRKFDKMVMNFIRAMVTNHYASGEKTNYLKILLSKEHETISFQQYVENNCLEEKAIIDMISILDLIKHGNENVKQYIQGFYYYHELEIFETVINNSFNQSGYVERLKFYAYTQYLCRWKTPNGFEDVAGLNVWMRVIHNLTENTAPYNNENAFVTSLKSINSLLPKSNEILGHLLVLDKLIGFDELQFKEEKLKAILIFKDAEWKQLIYSAEQHNYFNGQIGFILFLSGIEEYYLSNGDCNWSNDMDRQLKSKFTNYRDKALTVFNSEGLVKFPKFLWERALLTQGCYLIKEGSNQSFLINRDRDISWKRLLKRDKALEHDSIVKGIFDSVNTDNIEDSLLKLIYECRENGWATEFISNPKLFEYLGPKRYIRQSSPHGFVLFSGERLSGTHAELFTYSLFLKSIEKGNFLPFMKTDKYYFAIGDDYYDRPCIKLEECCIEQIYYSIKAYFFHEEINGKPYQIRFEKIKGNRNLTDYRENIKLLLAESGLTWCDDKNWAGFWLEKKSEEGCLKALKKICESLKRISV